MPCIVLPYFRDSDIRTNSIYQDRCEKYVSGQYKKPLDQLP